MRRSQFHTFIMTKYHFLILSSVLIISQIRCETKLQVDVLYESLCPDSLKFITQQLHPVAKELAPYIDLKLVPFGKSISLKTTEESAQFICQHGPQECKGNRLQSCTLNAVSDQNLQVEYVNCFMQVFTKGRRNEEEFGQQCSDAIGLNFNIVDECYNSALGTELQLVAEQLTSSISPKFVPTIIYNKNFDQKLQDDSLQDFRGVVCSLIKQTHPGACHV